MTIHPTLSDLAVPIDSVSRHPRNARTHDLDAIAGSLEVHGQYRPIVVNHRDKLVLAGNGTHEAAERLGWGEIAVTWVDVDDPTALRILAVDNRANDLASYEDQALFDLLEEIAAEEGGLDGTGFTSQALEDLEAKLAPPNLDDLADTYGEPSPEDFWPVIRVKVHPADYARWQKLVDAADADERRAFSNLLDTLDREPAA